MYVGIRKKRKEWWLEILIAALCTLITQLVLSIFTLLYDLYKDRREEKRRNDKKKRKRE